MPFRPDRLKELREAKGWSQEQLAKRADLSQPVITKSECGKNSPRSRVLDKLAEALDCSLDYLHGRGPEYASPSSAAAEMAFDIFARQQALTDEQRERCRRALRHTDAPKTVPAWRSLMEMIELAIGSKPSSSSLSLIRPRRTRSKS